MNASDEKIKQRRCCIIIFIRFIFLITWKNQASADWVNDFNVIYRNYLPIHRLKVPSIMVSIPLSTSGVE
jgi:hypothetical protein